MTVKTKICSSECGPPIQSSVRLKQTIVDGGAEFQLELNGPCADVAAISVVVLDSSRREIDDDCAEVSFRNSLSWAGESQKHSFFLPDAIWSRTLFLGIYAGDLVNSNYRCDDTTFILELSRRHLPVRLGMQRRTYPMLQKCTADRVFEYLRAHSQSLRADSDRARDAQREIYFRLFGGMDLPLISIGKELRDE